MRARARMMFHVSLLVFCAPFVTKLTDVRRQNARRPSSRRRTSAILVGLYQNRNTLSKCRVIPNRREESQHCHMRFLVASTCRNDKMIAKLYFETASFRPIGMIKENLFYYITWPFKKSTPAGNRTRIGGLGNRSSIHWTTGAHFDACKVSAFSLKCHSLHENILYYNNSLRYLHLIQR